MSLVSDKFRDANFTKQAILASLPTKGKPNTKSVTNIFYLFINKKCIVQALYPNPSTQ